MLSDGSALTGVCRRDWERVGDSGIDFKGRLLDLKSAYKQMPVHPDSLWASNVHVQSADTATPLYFTSNALLFGATASVYSFNRFARAIWRCFTVHLNLLCTQFYDDYPMLEPAQTAVHARAASTEFLDILGIIWSAGDKDKEFLSTFEPLGVSMDLSGMATRAEIVISNKQSRVDSICAQIGSVLEQNSLSPPLASELHGKVQFSQAQVFGRSALPALQEIGHRSHQPGNPYELTPRLRKALSFLQDHLRTAPPRKVSACDPSRNLIIFSDGAFEDGKATWGFVIFDGATGAISVAGSTVPQELVLYWLATVGEQIITQVELFAVIAARLHLGIECKSRKVVYYIDNDAARDSLIRGFSESNASLSLIFLFYQLERSSASFLWFARVASHSNIADGPSRGEAVQVAKALNAKLVAFTLPPEYLNTLLQFEGVSV